MEMCPLPASPGKPEGSTGAGDRSAAGRFVSPWCSNIRKQINETRTRLAVTY